MQKSNSIIQLREAKMADLAILQYWDTQKHVLESDPNDDWNWETELGRKPFWRSQLMAELNGRPIGFIQIIDPKVEETKYWGDVGYGRRAIDIWIGCSEDLNKGHGTEMMYQAIQLCFQDADVMEILIDPLAGNTKAHRFYERLGFRFVRKQRFGEDDCHIYSLSEDTWRTLHPEMYNSI